jgi:hypothetical protein
VCPEIFVYFFQKELFLLTSRQLGHNTKSYVMKGVSEHGVNKCFKSWKGRSDLCGPHNQVSTK